MNRNTKRKLLSLFGHVTLLAAIACTVPYSIDILTKGHIMSDLDILFSNAPSLLAALVLYLLGCVIILAEVSVK